MNHSVTTDFAASVGGGANFMRMQTSQDVGSSITSNGNLTVSAGTLRQAQGDRGGNINATAATIQSSQGATNLIAGNTISLLAGQKTSDMAWGSETKTSGFLSSSSTVRRETGSSTQAVGTTVGGNNVNVTANKDINIKGSTVISDSTANLTAGNNINIQAAVNTQSQTSFTETKETGFLSGGGFGITYGSRTQSLDQKSQSTTAAASTVGAITGNININAGQTFRQVGSDLIAPAGDINITAKKVDIVEARETSQTTTEQKFKQTALTLSVSSPVISAIQQGQGMAQAASQTSSGRMKALAGASTALNLYNNAGDITKSTQALASGNPAAAASITLSLGTSKSQSNSSSKSDTARGSTVGAGRNINITATGDGQNSNILIQGSDVKAANNTTLAADNQVNLLAAKNESNQTSTNSSSSGSLSISWGAGGWGAGASASKGKGKSDGEDTIFTNTNVTAGNTATIKSGGDTNVIGAVVEANQIKADIGGSLKIESLQDKSTYSSEQKNVSGSVSVGGGGNGASVSASKSNVDSSFQSVGQQSGLKAGDGGFQVSVNNNTTLTGAVIASTQSAVDSGKNSFTTGGALTITDIQNTASFSGKAVGGTVGVGSQLGSSGAGVGNKSGNAASTSSAGISGIAGNTAVRTGDAETGLQRIFNADKVQREINAQVAITTAFTQQAGKAADTYYVNQRQQLQERLKQATTDEEKQQAQQALKDLVLQERVINILIGAVTGNAGSAITKEGLSAAADEMRQLMIADSKKFAGVTDGTTELTNMSGTSEGVRGDGNKIGGTRADLDLLCGSDNSRCRTNDDLTLRLNEKGQVEYLPEQAGGLSLADFIKTPEGQKMSGATGGIQGAQGTLFGIPYSPGSWQDKLIEAFSGTHDFIGGKSTGLYDAQGNIKRGMTADERATYDKLITTSALVPTIPFAAAELVPSPVWNAISIFLKAAR